MLLSSAVVLCHQLHSATCARASPPRIPGRRIPPSLLCPSSHLYMSPAAAPTAASLSSHRCLHLALLHVRFLSHSITRTPSEFSRPLHDSEHSPTSPLRLHKLRHAPPLLRQLRRMALAPCSGRTSAPRVCPSAASRVENSGQTGCAAPHLPQATTGH
jgi:hypothetical protein